MNKKLILNILIILTGFKALAFAEDMVVPAMKSPYPIKNEEWSKSGDYFAYEVNGNVYIRDALSLLLKDSYQKNTASELSAFYDNPSQIDYPKYTIKNYGTRLIIKSQKNGSESLESKTVTNLPAQVLTAVANDDTTHLAFIGADGNAYIYDINAAAVKASIPCNSSVRKVSITKRNTVLISDSDKTVGVYDFEGKKLRTCVNSSSITGFSVSSDGETLIIFGSNGILSFYNANSANQIGYIPNLGSKNIKNALLSKDSKRILITTDNTLFISPVQDILFSPNMVAPGSRQFSFNYNALDPREKNAGGVTEFGVHEVDVTKADVNTEYILSTREKELGKQNFDLEEEKKPAADIILSNQPEQAYFPPSYIESEKDVTFSDKTNKVVENNIKVQEYQPPRTYTVPEPDPGLEQQIFMNKPVESKPKEFPSFQEFTQPQENVLVEGNKTETTAIPAPYNGNINITINEPVIETEKPLTAKEKRAIAKAEKEKAKEENKKEPKEEKKSPIEEKIKEQFKMSDEDVKTKFKDGHGLIFDVGFAFLPDPYLIDIRIPMGYRNYDLLRPFYFGGSLEPYFGIHKYDFPFEYKINGNFVTAPNLAGIRLYSPIGFAFYPLKNSFEVYAELNLGMSVNFLWNGQIGGYFIKSSVFPAFYSALKIGAAWDFINLGICAVYDAMFGLSFSAELGVCINLGGSRNVGGSRFK